MSKACRVPKAAEMSLLSRMHELGAAAAGGPHGGVWKAPVAPPQRPPSCPLPSPSQQRALASRETPHYHAHTCTLCISALGKCFFFSQRNRQQGPLERRQLALTLAVNSRPRSRDSLAQDQEKQWILISANIPVLLSCSCKFIFLRLSVWAWTSSLPAGWPPLQRATRRARK